MTGDESEPPDELDAVEARHELEQLRFARMRVELDPHDPLGYLDLGVLLLANGRVEGADDAFEHVLAIEPGEPNARYYRALIADSWGDTDHALRELTRLAYWFPHAGDVLFAPIESMIDKVVRHMHAQFAIFTALAAAIGMFSNPEHVSLGPAIIALALLALGLGSAALRAAAAWRQISGRSFRSLVRMILRRDTVLRVALALDAVAGLAIVAMILVPPSAWKPIGLGALALILVATVLQAFTSRVPPTPVSENGD